MMVLLTTSWSQNMSAQVAQDATAQLLPGHVLWHLTGMTYLKVHTHLLHLMHWVAPGYRSGSMMVLLLTTSWSQNMSAQVAQDAKALLLPGHALWRLTAMTLPTAIYNPSRLILQARPGYRSGSMMVPVTSRF